MKALLKPIYSEFEHAFKVIDNLTKPNPKYTPDKVQQQVAHNRNKALFAFQLIMIGIFIIDFLFGSSPVVNSLFNVLMDFTIIGFLLLSCRFHPEIFRIFYNVLISSYGPISMLYNKEGVHLAWVGAQTCPVFVLLSTGSAYHFFFQAGLQAVYINWLYQPAMLRAVEELSPEKFTQIMTYSSNLSTLLNMILIMLFHKSLQNAYREMSVVEKKKDEFEKQKNFLLGFSHELRNLLNSLTGNVKLAKLEFISDKVKDLLLNAEVCGELLLHLVNNILDTGKVEIGELEINPSPVKIYDMMERIWGVCSELIRRKNLKGKMKLKKNLPCTLNIDHYRLTQIFLNLVGNAIKFTERGSIDITIEWLPAQTEVTDKCFEPIPFNDENDQDEGIFEKSQRFSLLDPSFVFLDSHRTKVARPELNRTSLETKGVLKVVVSDTGCGIPKEDTLKLFQRFSQVTRDNSKRKLGTGLGLFITKELCKRMDGDVRVFSKLDKGSSFIFCLPVEPLSDKHLNCSQVDIVREIMTATKLKGMIVDDVPFNSLIIKELFVKLGIEIKDMAENGLEAYEKFMDRVLRRDNLDIIALDLDMPIMDGKKVAQKIREKEIELNLKNCLIIITSGNCSESEIKECIDPQGRIRADAFLKKPISFEELVRVISTKFEKRH